MSKLRAISVKKKTANEEHKQLGHLKIVAGEYCLNDT